MANADGFTAERPLQSRLADALPRLLSDLRQADIDVGTEQYVAACDILVRFTGTSRLLSPMELRATLAGIFCTSPSEQSRFPEIFDSWYRSLSVGSEGGAPPPPGPPQPPTWPGIGRLDRVRAWCISAGVCLLVVGVLLWQFIPQESHKPEGISPSETKTETPLPPLTPTTRRLMPREPLEPIVPPPTYRPLWATFGQEAWIGVCSLWGLWVVARLALHQTVLTRRRQRPGEQIRLESIRLAVERGSLFSTPVLTDTWRYLRQFRTMPSKRLNERATIDRTLEAGGYFRPVYRERQIPPAYLLLIDRRHGEDHAAAMAAEFEAALRREQIACATFDYHEDPRDCRLAGESGAARGPAYLAGVYGDRTLLLAGDGDALFDPDTGRPQSWMQEFSLFEQKHMLTTDPAWCQLDRMKDLEQVGFHVLPLTTGGLHQLRPRGQPIEADDPRDFPLPRRFAVSPGYWLEERSIRRTVRRAVLRELKEYLGPEGFLLLSATAAYPGIYWQLTRALDAQLGLAGIDRGLRLRKLARLPWYRYGRMSDTVRLALIRSLDRGNRRRISDAYHSLIEHRTQDPLDLPVTVPDWTKVRAELREMAQVSERHEPLGDRVFADVIRGRKPRALEFGLAPWLPAPLGRHHWRSVIGPVLAGVALIPAAIWVNAWVWQSWGEPHAQGQALTRMQEAHLGIRVQVSSSAPLKPMAQALEQALVSWGFEVDGSKRNDQIQRTQKKFDLPLSRVEQANRPRESERERPRVIHRPGQEALANVIAKRVTYLHYGLAPLLQAGDSEALKDADILVELAGMPRGFRDPFKAADVREPAMVVIPAGSFKMGDRQGRGATDELPVREVRISQSFAMAKFEVAFDEYDSFAVQTDRLLPNDEGWGRGRQPAINVSWEDAKAYAKWLSQQTGKRYRLPTEAEWEYAARNGGKDTEWAGTSDEKQLADYAVYAVNAGGRTALAGSKRPNGLGLSDMSGNVWEWVEDCWHEIYRGAPSDGSAWREAGGGDCGLRVLRGGSWYSKPGTLRVSYRNRLDADNRFDIIGFRLAQDIP